MGLGRRIREIRQDLGLTLTQLAASSRVSKPYLSQLENEQFSNPSTEILVKLCNALGVSFNTILGFGNDAITNMTNVNVPTHLRTLAKEADLGQDEIAMLANISYNGKQPNSIDGWRSVLEAIRQSTKDRT